MEILLEIFRTLQGNPIIPLENIIIYCISPENLQDASEHSQEFVINSEDP